MVRIDRLYAVTSNSAQDGKEIVPSLGLRRRSITILGLRRRSITILGLRRRSVLSLK